MLLTIYTASAMSTAPAQACRETDISFRCPRSSRYITAKTAPPNRSIKGVSA